MFNPKTTKYFLACSIVACPLFIITFLIEGVTRLNYNPFHDPVSSLSIGDLGWIQAANFIITGLFVFASSIGLRRALYPNPIGATWGPLLIGLVGVGLIGAGFFTTDPLPGYPPGVPFNPTYHSVHGSLHNLFSMFVFIGLPAACFVLRRRFALIGERRWTAYSVFTGFAMPLAFILAAIGFKQTPGFADFAGIFQRISIIIGWTWITLLSVHFLRSQKSDG